MPPSLLPPTPEELEELRQRRRASQLKGYGEGAEDPAAQALLGVRRNLGEAGRAAVGAKPYDETNPTGSYRAVQALMNAPTPAAIIPEAAQAAGKAALALGGLGAATASTLSRSGALPGVAVVKPKGGNWLAGSVERGLEPLRRPLFPGRLPFGSDEHAIAAALGETPEAVMAMADPRSKAINNWIDTKLNKYVRNEMATPEDPVRALAERGVLHRNTYDLGEPSDVIIRKRSAAGQDPQGAAQSPEARFWEYVTDRAIDPAQAADFKYGSLDESILQKNPWLEKVADEATVYSAKGLQRDLGFEHLIDELRNATDPNSGLPRSLQLSPDKLQKVTVPQAVELVDKINKWRAEQKAAADLKRSQNAATVEHKTYETIPGTTAPNERGLRWVELTLPSEQEDVSSMIIKNAGKYSILEPGQKLSWKDPNTGRILFDTPEKAAKAYTEHKHYASLEDALKYEGETMGHCVGGYCPDVIEGRSKIYSLRDKKGEPHVTIEVAPHNPNLESVYAKQNLPELYAKYRNIPTVDRPSWPKFLKTEAPELLNATENKIIQIKGKANRAPKDEYLPFVQDFVRSGQWSTVGDIKNTGLFRKSDFIDEFTPEQLDAAGKGEYLTMGEIKNLREGKSWKPIDTDPELDIDPNALGMKAGGAVRMKDGGKPPKRRASDLPGYGEGSAGALTDIVRGLTGEKPAEPTNPSELFRLAQALGAFPPVAGAVGAVKRPAGAAAALRELLRTEAPAQSAAAREALRRAYRTGHEHSVVGLTQAGGPGEIVTSGNRTRVIPSAADVSRAVNDPQRRAMVDFHTHPSDVSGLRVAPSADDVAFYADYERGPHPRTLKTFIASPPSTGGGRASTAYSFFETDVPRRVYDKDLFEKAELELQNAGRLGRFDRVRRDPAFAAAFESGSVDLQDLLGEAAPLLLLERRAAQGAGRQRLDLGANAVAPNAELRDFYEMIREPAQEFLKKNKLKAGGAVKIETNPTLIADELLFKGYRR